MASSEGVKLIGAWQSTFVIRARIALNIKSVKYEFLEETIGSKSELLLKSNPAHKKIPVLIHGDRPICESLVIVQYIDEVWDSSGPSILPSDPYDRAIERFWAAYIDDKWFPQAKALLMADEEEDKTAIVKDLKKSIALLEEAFIKCSKGQKFFSGGNKIGFLDIAFGCFLTWIRVIQKRTSVSLIDKSQSPNLFKWAQDFSADVAVKDVLPETDKLLQVVNAVIARYKAQGNS